MTYKEEFITFMVRSGVLTFGDFTTKSGRKTPYFVNTGNYKTGAQAAKLLADGIRRPNFQTQTYATASNLIVRASTKRR